MRAPKLMPDPDRTGKQISVQEYRARIRDKAAERRRRRHEARKDRKRDARQARKDAREERKTNRKAAKRDRAHKKFRELAAALRENRPLMFALGAEVLFVPITVFGNLMFLQSLNGWSWFWFLQFPLALAPEFLTWVFATNASTLANERLPYSMQTRLMWCSAAIAASLNAYHGVATLHNSSMAWMLGFPSVAGPGVWHVYLHLRKRKLAKRSGDDIISDMWLRIGHPILMFRRRMLWATKKGHMSLEQAWFEVYRQSKGCYPGQVRSPEYVTFRNQWLWRLMRPLFGRIVTPPVRVITIRPASAPLISASNSAAEAPASSAESPAGGVADQRGDEVSISADQTEALAVVGGGPGEIDPALFDAELAEFLASLHEPGNAAEVPPTSALMPSSKGENGESAPSSNRAESPAGGVADQRGDEVSDQRGLGDTNSADRHDQDSADQRSEGGWIGRRRTRRKERRKRVEDAPTLIENYVRKRVADGADLMATKGPLAITGPQASKATGVSEQHARSLLATMRREAAESAASQERHA